MGEGPGATEVLAVPYPEAAPVPGGGERKRPRVWIADRLGTAAAERIIAQGDGFIDGAGNVHLDLPGLIVRVRGRKRAKAPQPLEVATRRDWRGPALRVLFQLLCDPALAERPLREVAAAGGTAPGTIVHLMRDLERTGNLVRLGGRKRRFIPDEHLVDIWIDEYARKMRPKILLGRYAAMRGEWAEEFDVAEHGAVWGGESAAARLGADLRGGVKTLYTDRPVEGILAAARLRPDREGDVEIRRVFWSEGATAPRGDVTPALLVAADLLAVGDDRCRAAARFVRGECRVGLLDEG